MRSLLFVAVLFASAVAASACDDMNKPAYVPRSEPRTTCFSDVECPGTKCIKNSANDIQGHCASASPAPSASSTSPASSPPEAGASSPSTVDASAPVSPKPAPGDVSM